MHVETHAQVCIHTSIKDVFNHVQCQTPTIVIGVRKHPALELSTMCSKNLLIAMHHATYKLQQTEEMKTQIHVHTMIQSHVSHFTSLIIHRKPIFPSTLLLIKL